MIGSCVVVGAGRTAPPIAAALAVASGSRVRILARRSEAARSAAGEATALAGREVGWAALEPTALADADLVVESVAEDLEVKRSVLTLVGEAAPAEAIVATNTSSLSLALLSEWVPRPERFAGLHFLHPAQATAVVEVIAAPSTAEATLATLAQGVREIGKRPILVRQDVPGFVWNRLQFALLRECLQLLEDGVADAEAIDAAVADGLAPRWMASGPLATADLGGLQTFATVAGELNRSLAATPEVSSELSERASADGSFHHWTPERLREVEELRTEALALGAELAGRRRQAMGEEL